MVPVNILVYLNKGKLSIKAKYLTNKLRNKQKKIQTNKQKNIIRTSIENTEKRKDRKNRKSAKIIFNYEAKIYVKIVISKDILKIK